ncbi:MAG: ATP-binding protein [Gemmatimonadales bacterium]
MTTPAPPAAGPRRHLLLIGVAHYPEGWGDIAAEVEAEIARARALFLDEFRYEPATLERVADTTQAGVRNGIAAWLERLPAGPDDLVAVYYTGHGVVDRSVFRLVTSEVAAARPSTAMAASDLIPLVWTGDRHVLLILDTCHAGAGTAEAMALLGRLREADGGAARGYGLHLVAAARSIELARTRAFMDALDEVVRTGRAGGSEEEYLRPDAVLEQVNALLGAAADGVRQHAELTGRAEGLFRFFPNAWWDPRLRVGTAPEEARAVLARLQRATLASHWGPRARGVAAASEGSWLFTGRSRAVRRLLAWLEAPAGGAGLIVTGPPGAGKSALLARVVTLADPVVREEARRAGALEGVPDQELPRLGLVTVAVHARRKTAADVALELAVALGADLASGETDPEVLARAAAVGRAEPATVVIDALDEAQQPEQLAALLRSLVERAPRLRLVVGLRADGGASRLARSLGRRFEVLDVSSAEYLRAADITAYVERSLRAPDGSPYRAPGQEEYARKVSRAIGRRAGGSFLVASITARVLAGRAAVIPTAELGRLPAEVGEAFGFDLQRFTPAEQLEAVAVLGALAFAQGRGLPLALWPAFAEAIGGVAFDEHDLERWLERAGYYVTRDVGQGVAVFRLYHEEFGRFLRARAQALLAEREGAGANLEARLAAVLDGAVPRGADGGPDWAAAPSYVRGYLARHYRLAGRRDDLMALVEAPGWIAARTAGGDPAPLLRDLDVAIHAAREATPPDAVAIARLALAYGRWMTTAPPLIVDVLAAAGQGERAALIADNIAYPLDRCQAFCLLAERNTADPGRAKAQFLEALTAAQAMHDSYRVVTGAWLVRVARALGDEVSARRLARQALRWTQVMASEARGTPLDMRDWDRADQELFARPEVRAALAGEPAAPGGMRWRLMELDHAIFWAAMALRQAQDEAGLAEVRALLAGGGLPIGNLRLQAAAVAGDAAFLDQLLPWNDPEGSRASAGTHQGNLALALATAGRCEEAARLPEMAPGAHQRVRSNYHDSAKRLAWALTLCGRLDEALAFVEGMPHPEERFRALYRIAEVLHDRRDTAGLDRVATLAERLLAVEEAVRARLDGPERPAAAVRRRGKAARRRASAAGADQDPRWQEFTVADFWRLRTWAAWILQAAGRTGPALALAEAVCAEEVQPSDATTLVRPTRVTELAKPHVAPPAAASPERAVMTRVFALAAGPDIEAARKLAETLTLPRYRARARAAVAVRLPDREAARALWLTAVIEARRVGTGVVLEVLQRGRRLLGPSARARAMDALLDAARPRTA